uniref:Uncharacterized protein n=1 Tax=Oryza brachyantha TaxID=4533 RepID=J3N7G7_ORYBR
MELLRPAVHTVAGPSPRHLCPRPAKMLATNSKAAAISREGRQGDDDPPADDLRRRRSHSAVSLPDLRRRRPARTSEEEERKRREGVVSSRRTRGRKNNEGHFRPFSPLQVTKMSK